MKQSLFVVLMFVVGCVVGAWFELDWELHDVSMYILYVLMFQVASVWDAATIWKAVLEPLPAQNVASPLATVTGTLIFAALISFVLARWNVFDCMAVEVVWLLLTFVYPDYAPQDGHAGRTISHRVGCHCLACQHLPRIVSFDAGSVLPPPFRSVCTDFGCRSNQHRCGTACHCPLLRQGVCTDSYLPWYVARPECPPHSSVPLRILTNEEPLLLSGEDYSIH